MFTLEDKAAFVTGGASGIGLAVAKLFADHGAAVVIADRADGADLASEFGGHFVAVDVSSEDSVCEALHTAEGLVGKLDILVNNAGVGDIGPEITATQQALIEKVTRINHFGVLYGLKHGPAHMNDGGSIINTSSMASMISMPGSAVYSAGKRAVNSLTEMSALELGARGIRVNAVCPGYIDTALGSAEEGRKLSQAFTALGRAGTTEDVAGVFLFLASDASRYISGESLRVDGGWHCGPTPQLLDLVIGSGTVG
jgi:NAD(P)-dependent dehydrogenase (short-subunit alcohol dehydrogenase family)